MLNGQLCNRFLNDRVRLSRNRVTPYGARSKQKIKWSIKRLPTSACSGQKKSLYLEICNQPRQRKSFSISRAGYPSCAKKQKVYQKLRKHSLWHQVLKTLLLRCLKKFKTSDLSGLVSILFGEVLMSSANSNGLVLILERSDAI